nr:immunoglobulin heavy chain junction region [Mus musculus]MBK4196866.1 immunoglobulin heavy chain junction region [Mus musculus]MBK4196867.1 immunoglobulin heavy chain junction region [Mus musculus]
CARSRDYDVLLAYW